MSINRRHADGSIGRRLTPAELARAAAAMGLPVSGDSDPAQAALLLALAQV